MATDEVFIHRPDNNALVPLDEYKRVIQTMSTIDFFQVPYTDASDQAFIDNLSDKERVYTNTELSLDDVRDIPEFEHQERLYDAINAVMESETFKTWEDNAMLQTLHLIHAARFFYEHDHRNMRLIQAAIQARRKREKVNRTDPEDRFKEFSATIGRAVLTSDVLSGNCTKALSHADELFKRNPEKSFYGKSARFTLMNGETLDGKILGWSAWEQAEKGRGIFVLFKNEHWGQTQVRADKITILPREA